MPPQIKRMGEVKGKHSFTLNNNTGNKAPAGVGAICWGVGLIALREDQGVYGRYNHPDEDAIFVVGNGTSNEERLNAIVVRQDGEVTNYGGEIFVEINGILVNVMVNLNNRAQKVYMAHGE